MTSDAGKLAWLDGHGPLSDIFCVSFLHRLEPVEVARRFGAVAPHREAVSFDELIGLIAEYVERTAGGSGSGYVGVFRSGGWSVAIEPYGWLGTLPDVVTALSRSTEVVAVNRHDYAEHAFVHAVDGTVTTAFRPTTISAAFAAAAETTGVLFTRDLLDRPLLVGDIRT